MALQNSEKLKKARISITLKTSLICGAVVLTCLVISNLIFFALESNLVTSIINDNLKVAEKAIDDEGSVQKGALDERLKVTSKICATISASFLYNIDVDGLKLTLNPYMEMSEILAIEVLDHNNQPFFAYWKSNGLKSGTTIPDEVLKAGAFRNELTLTEASYYQSEKVGSLRLHMTDELLLAHLNRKKEEAKNQEQKLRSLTDDRLNKVMITQILVAVTVVLLLITTVTLSLRLIVIRPIKGLIDRIKDMAEGEGDLTVRLDVKNNDEMGDLAGWVNIFIDRLQAMIKQIVGNSDTLNQSSMELSQLSDQMAAGAGQMSEKSNIVTSSVSEMSTNMESVASAMEEASSNMNMVASSTEEMTATIKEIAQNSEKARNITENAVTRVKDASVKVDALGSAAQKIGKVTEVITEISEQTNLLALNATIEAARAGEAGKGFAVVANEIKELAKQTAEATQEIKASIGEIQNSTSGTIDEIGTILDTINSINEIVGTIATAVEEQSVTTREIATNVSQASLGIGEVNENVAQSSTVSASIATEVGDVNYAASEISNSSSQMSLSSKELNDLAEELKAMVNKFKV